MTFVLYDNCYSSVCPINIFLLSVRHILNFHTQCLSNAAFVFPAFLYSAIILLSNHTFVLSDSFISSVCPIRCCLLGLSLPDICISCIYLFCPISTLSILHLSYLTFVISVFVLPDNYYSSVCPILYVSLWPMFNDHP